MGALALLLQPPPLADPEPVLLVDHRQGQAVERHVLLEQRVGADRDLDGARGQGPQLLGPRRAFVAAGEQEHAHALGLQGAGNRLEVLTRQDLGRGHEHRLQPGLGRIGHGQHGDYCLA